MITIAVGLVVLVLTLVLMFELTAFVAMTPIWVWIIKKLIWLIIAIVGYKVARYYWKNYYQKNEKK